MFKRNARSAAALAMIGTLSAISAMAQEASPEKLERIEITGSRIKSVGAESSSPITSVGKEDINVKQPVAIEELVKDLPAAYPAIGPGLNNGSTGIASVDLRGLGSNRTLVLFNGKRFVPANLGGVVDTNNVPVSLLDRVDLVTGGASAVYGADAVSGVVNFVTKRNFSGVEASTLYSVSEKGDAARYKSDLTIGANLPDGRGNVALYVGRTRTNPLTQGERDFSVFSIDSTTGGSGGSSTAVPAVWAGMVPAALSGSKVIDATTGKFRAATANDNYNFNPPNYFETPLTRTQFAALGHFRINDSVEAYAEIFHTKSNVTLNLAPSGSFTSTYNINIGNPYIPETIRTELCAGFGVAAANCVVGNPTVFRSQVRRRFVEAGPRVYSYDNQSSQYTAGLRGDIPFLDGWSWDAYYQSGKSDQSQRTANGFSAVKLQQALLATSKTACTVTTGGCVPINLFGAAGSITPEMLAFLTIPTFQTTTVQQDVMALSANGEVSFLQSPWAKTPLSMALGVESRTTFGGNSSDAVIQTPGVLLGAGAATPDRSGTLEFKDIYTEVNLPLVQNLPLIKSLNLGGGYRRTEFSTSAGASQSYGSWKAGLDWSPMKGLRFRGEQQRATRAPNVNELYQPIVTGLSTLTVDPCQEGFINTGDAGKAGTLTNLCQQTGVPSNQIGQVGKPSAGQINNTSGGNPNLGPEKADTTTIGLVWEPSFADNLTFNLDYWKIKINEAVSSATTSEVVDGCYKAALNPGYSYNVFCQQIQRDPSAGGLNGGAGVITQSSNLGKYLTSGIDVGVAYRLPMKAVGAPDLGRLDFSLQLTYLEKWDFNSTPTADTIKCAGLFGLNCGSPYSKTRFSQRTTWTLGDFGFSYNWRHIGGVTVEAAQAAPLPEYRSIKAYDYVDLSASWQLMKNLKLALNINNAFDKAPPLIGTGSGGTYNSGNTFPASYDVIGRRFTFVATAKF